MGKVIVDMSITLDGFIAGPNDSVANPLGINGGPIHQWKSVLESWRAPQGLKGGKTNENSEIIDETTSYVGAHIVGRNMYDFAEGWGDNPPFHAPVFVVTHRAEEKQVKEGGTTFIFVTDGIESALAQARAAVGDKDVSIGGGADIVRQYIKAGLIDVIQLHVVPLLMGSGKRLFDHLGAELIDLKPIRVAESAEVTHLKYTFHKS